MKPSEIHIVDSAESCQIDIEGTIGLPEESQFEHPEERVATYEKFREALRRIAAIEAPEVIVNIRSTGGDVNDALLIHDALRGLDARIVTRCYGYTASAATIIAQAASEGERALSANSLYLIHNAVCATEGNADELASRVELLRQTDARIAGVYAARSGRPAEEFAALMAANNGSGRWLSPEEAIAAGLADRLIEAAETSETDEPADPAETPAGPDEATEPAEPAGAPAATGRTANSVVQGWRRLLAAVGIRRLRQRTTRRTAAEPLPADRNVLHFDAALRAELQQRSQLAAEEARARFGPTTLLPREDPSYSETLRTANERAYAEDARCFRN